MYYITLTRDQHSESLVFLGLGRKKPDGKEMAFS